MSVEALSSSVTGTGAMRDVTDVTSFATTYECSCQGDEADRQYVGDGLLHPRYVLQFLRRRSGSDCKLVYCKSVATCSEFRHGRCNGHVPLQYIKECNSSCPCAPDCPNRVVQRGLKAKLEVFYVNVHKGWGIRTTEALRRGTFVFEYAGEVVTNAELLRRGDRLKYALALDADWQAEAEKDDYSLLCIDATEFTNVGRWLNHRCGDANLMDMPVWVETRTPTLYHVAFFANRIIEVGEELTWDYGLQFDEQPPPFQCHCGSSACRGQ